MSKRILSIILAVSMICGLCSISVFADENIEYSKIAYYKDGSEIDNIILGDITAKVKVNNVSENLYFASVLYQNNKIIDADADTTPENSEYVTTVTVPSDTTGITLVSVLWTDVTGTTPICSSAITSTVAGEGDNAELTSLSVDNGTLEFDPADEDGIFEVVLDDVGAVNAPYVTYTTADAGATVEITDPTEFPGETVIKVTDGSAEKEYRIKYSFEGDLLTDTPEGITYKKNLEVGAKLQRFVGNATYIDESILGKDYIAVSASDNPTYSFNLLRGATVHALMRINETDNPFGNGEYIGYDDNGWDKGPENNWANEEDCGCDYDKHHDYGCYCILDESGNCTGVSRIGNGLDDFAMYGIDPSSNVGTKYDEKEQGWFYADYRTGRPTRPHQIGAFNIKHTAKYSIDPESKVATVNIAKVSSAGAIKTSIPCVIEWDGWEENTYPYMSGTNTSNVSVMDDYEVNETELTIWAEALEGVEKNDWITIQILKKGKNFENLTGNIKEDFIYFMQIPANEKNGYSVKVNMSGEPADFYEVRVNGEKAGEIYYTSAEAKNDIFQLIIDNCSPEGKDYVDRDTAKAYLATNFDLKNEKSIWKNSFAIMENITDIASEDGLFDVFIGMIPELSADNVKERIYLSAYITGLNENKISDITLYKDALGLAPESEDDKDYIEQYNKHITDKENFVSTYFSGKGYKTKAEIQAVFKEVVLNSLISDIIGWENVSDIINDFGADLGINMTKDDSEYCIEVMETGELSDLYESIIKKGSFSSVSSFAEFVNEEMKDILKPSSGGGNLGNGGVGGGTTNTGGGTQLTQPIVPTETVPTAPQISIFKDMEDFDWAEEAIEALYKKGIVSGTGNGNYEPSRNVTREEMLIMLLRAFEVEIGEEVSDFTDAEQDGWYTTYLAAAKKAGFVSGKPDGSFGVGEAVTREDAAVMAYNIAKVKGIEFNIEKGETFADDTDVSDYASDAVYALKNAEVINGKGEGIFAPKANCTRAEAAKIIYTLISK